jgi:hypothetical protein
MDWCEEKKIYFDTRNMVSRVARKAYLDSSEDRFIKVYEVKEPE